MLCVRRAADLSLPSSTDYELAYFLKSIPGTVIIFAVFIRWNEMKDTIAERNILPPKDENDYAQHNG
jgi:hypothetical protein